MRTALLLAAGESRRFGRNKLLSTVRDPELGEDLMVRVVARKFLEAGAFDEVIVVVGFEYGRVVEALADLDVKFVYNPDYRAGMSTSVVAGARRVSGYARLLAVHPSDVPFVRVRTVAHLARAAAEALGEDRILIPRYRGRGGHPILLTGGLVREAAMVREEERGLKGLVARHSGRVVYVDVDDPGVALDIDSPEDLLRAEAIVAGHG